jgi:hypothetical protein
MNTSVCNAIKARKLIEFYYEGGTRIVEPYCGESWIKSISGNRL